MAHEIADGAVAWQAGQRVLVLRGLQLLFVDDLDQRGSGDDAGIAHVVRKDQAVAAFHIGEDRHQLLGVGIEADDRRHFDEV